MKDEKTEPMAKQDKFDMNRKRSSTDLNGDAQSKKPKINPTDFKIKKEIKEETNEDEEYMEPFAVKSSSSESSVNNKQNQESALRLPIVPLPTVSLNDILPVYSISSNQQNASKSYQAMAAGLLNRPEETQFSQMGDDEALASILKQKQSKRTLYTGRKVNPAGSLLRVPKLFDLAQRSLIESIDDLAIKISNYSKKCFSYLFHFTKFFKF